MKASSSHSTKPSGDWGKSKFTHEAPNMLKTNTEGNLFTRSKCSQSTHQVHSKSIDRWNASLHWSSWSMKSSTPSKISHESDAQNRSSTIPHFSGRRNNAPITTAKDTKPSTVGVAPRFSMYFWVVITYVIVYRIWILRSRASPDPNREPVLACCLIWPFWKSDLIDFSFRHCFLIF